MHKHAEISGRKDLDAALKEVDRLKSLAETLSGDLRQVRQENAELQRKYEATYQKAEDFRQRLLTIYATINGTPMYSNAPSSRPSLPQKTQSAPPAAPHRVGMVQPREGAAPAPAPRAAGLTSAPRTAGLSAALGAAAVLAKAKQAAASASGPALSAAPSRGTEAGPASLVAVSTSGSAGDSQSTEKAPSQENDPYEFDEGRSSPSLTPNKKRSRTADSEEEEDGQQQEEEPPPMPKRQGRNTAKYGLIFRGGGGLLSLSSSECGMIPLDDLTNPRTFVVAPSSTKNRRGVVDFHRPSAILKFVVVVDKEEMPTRTQRQRGVQISEETYTHPQRPSNVSLKEIMELVVKVWAGGSIDSPAQQWANTYHEGKLENFVKVLNSCCSSFKDLKNQLEAVLVHCEPTAKAGGRPVYDDEIVVTSD